MLRQSPVVRVGTVLFALTVVAAGVTSPVDASTRRGTSHVAVPRRHARRLRPTATGSVASSTTPAPSSTPAPSAVTPPSVTTAVPSATTLAAGPRPKAYVGLFKDNAVAVFDTSTNAVVAKIAVPAGPHGMVMTNDGGRVFVSSDGATVVSVIDTATDRIVDTIDVGGTPHGLTLTPDGQTVLVAVFDPGRVAFIDTKTDKITGTVVVAKPHNIAVSPDGRSAYVASQQPGAAALVLVDVGRRSVIGTTPLDAAPRALSFRPDGRELLYTVAGVNEVQGLDPATDRVVAHVAVGASPHHPAFSSDGNIGLVVSQTTGELAILRATDNAVIATVAVGKLPHWIATSSDNTTAFVTDEGSNDVSVVDLRTDRVTATISIGNGPRKIVVQPGTIVAPTPGAKPAGPPAIAVTTPTITTPTITTPTTTLASAPAPSNALAVSIASFAFGPSTLTVPVGATVTWTNGDGVPHTVTSDDRAFDSGSIAAKAKFSYTFAKAGTFQYSCSIHPFMTAKVVVTA